MPVHPKAGAQGNKAATMRAKPSATKRQLRQAPSAISLDFPHLCRPLDGRAIPTRSIARTSPRARPACRSPSICRRRPATTAITCWRSGEVGKVGVPICHLGDMRALFDQIPLGTMNTSMTINATAAWLMALYIAVADEQGAPRTRCTGTIQNDIIKEYLSRGTYVFPPAPSMRLIKDVAIFTTTELPKWNPMNICSYHLQEAGATPVQELAFALATAIAVLDTVKTVRRGRRRRSSARWSAASRSSSMPGCASSPRSARCAPSPSCGTRSRASATASPIPSSGCFATACR